MAQVTDPIILDSTGQAIKNSIDLLTANINRTASNIPYDNNLTIKGKIDDIDLTSGGTIDGALQIHGNTVVENSGTTDSYLLVGGSTSRGLERIYKNGYYTQIYHPNNLTANRELYLPDKTGTMALISDLNGAISTSVDFTPLSTPIFTKESINVVQVGKLVLVNVRLRAVSDLSAGVERQCGTFSNLISQGYIAGSVSRQNNSRPTGGFTIPTANLRLYIHLTESLAQDDIIMFSFQAFVN